MNAAVNPRMLMTLTKVRTGNNAVCSDRWQTFCSELTVKWGKFIVFQGHSQMGN